MNLTRACQRIFDQLAGLIAGMHSEDYSKASEALGNSTIGQHVRHTLEFYLCFERGFECGVINYDKRDHDRRLEVDKQFALNTLSRLSRFIESVTVERPLRLDVSYDHTGDDFVSVETNALRELVYNIEHSVHHMAIIKIGVREVAPYLALPDDFGVAASTVRWRMSADHATLGSVEQ